MLGWLVGWLAAVRSRTSHWLIAGWLALLYHDTGTVAILTREATTACAAGDVVVSVTATSDHAALYQLPQQCASFDSIASNLSAGLTQSQSERAPLQHSTVLGVPPLPSMCVCVCVCLCVA